MTKDEAGVGPLERNLQGFADRTLWLSGGGNGRIDISNILLASDVVVSGPGEPGPFVTPYRHKGRREKSVERFYGDVDEGDVIVLRVGASKIRGVGVVKSEPAYNTAFSDIDGWNVAHVRRCIWLWQGRHKWNGRGLSSQGARLVRSRHPAVRRWVGRLKIPSDAPKRRLRRIPPEGGEELSLRRLGKRLFSKGMGGSYTEDLISTLRGIRQLTAWFKGKEVRKEVSENDITAHVVVPVLHSLGWTQQLMALEWHGPDVALFAKLPRGPENVEAVVEVKRIGLGLWHAVKQAKRYVRDKRLSNCQKIVVTDGERWEVHRRRAGKWTRLAYFNMAHPREEYPLLHCGGAVTGLTSLMRSS